MSLREKDRWLVSRQGAYLGRTLPLKLLEQRHMEQWWLWA